MRYDFQMPPRSFLEFWVPPGCFLGATQVLLGVSWVPPGCLLGASWVPHGASWFHPGCLLSDSWVLLGASWGSPECILGASWAGKNCLAFRAGLIMFLVCSLSCRYP